MFTPSCRTSIGIDIENRQDIIQFFATSRSQESGIAFDTIAECQRAGKSGGHRGTLVNENNLQRITRSDRLQSTFTYTYNLDR
jgi:hypothetical protein